MALLPRDASAFGLAALTYTNETLLGRLGAGDAPVWSGLAKGRRLRDQFGAEVPASGREAAAWARANGHFDAVFYERRDPQEQWKNTEQILADGWEDCEGLAAALAAELRRMGVRGANPVAYRTAENLFHVVVRVPGAYLDPSRLGGMQGNGR